MTAPIIHLATSRERPAVRACATCAHVRGRIPFFQCCGATGLDISSERMFANSACGRDGAMWEPRPPRRSLARWIYDVFFAWGGER